MYLLANHVIKTILCKLNSSLGNVVDKGGLPLMIILQESATDNKTTKPVICLKCKRGKLGNIPERSETISSRRGKPPLEEQKDYVQVKCHICRSLWTLTIEN